MPFRDPEFKRLHYYGKYLLTKLPTRDTGGAVDLSRAVVLTHLRTALVAEQQDLSLAPDPAKPLPGLPGEGRGAQHEEPKSLLSELIDALNQKFGLDLSEADRIWFEQQQAELGSDDDVRAVALHNDPEQFAIYLKPRIEQAIVDRHQANGELFEAYFGSDERRELVDDFLIRSLYSSIRDQEAS